MTNMDKLYEAVEARGPVCVGLDTDFSYLPADFVDSTLTKGENIVRFNKKLIDATKAVAGCYKVQIAYYESLGMEGMKAYADTLKAVREAGVPVIADIKRGDIDKTVEMYAMGHFTGDFESDFVTLAPYMGLDTDFSYLPADFVDSTLSKGENIVRFNKRLIDATKAVAGCYKVQIAYYESLGLDGMRAYAETLKLARATGLPVIADIKRGDIAKTAEMYAKAHFTGDFEADIITLAPYMGLDSISPYLPYCAEQGKGVFVLCRTSNPGAKDFEYKKLDDGRHVYDLVGDSLTALGKDYMGEHGYSSIGLVIGGTHTEEATAIRAAYKDTFFLIPGYGAQGGKAADIAQYLTKGNGGVVNSSRGILLAYKKQPGVAFDEAAYNECVRMREDIQGECNKL